MTKFYCCATVETWSAYYGDYVVTSYEAYVTASSSEDALDQAREDWSQHGYNPDDGLVTVAAVPAEYA